MIAYAFVAAIIIFGIQEKIKDGGEYIRKSSVSGVSKVGYYLDDSSDWFVIEVNKEGEYNILYDYGEFVVVVHNGKSKILFKNSIGSFTQTYTFFVRKNKALISLK